jgi:hypothetical protein
MKATLTYGIFTAEVSMQEPLRQVAVPKPTAISVYQPELSNPADVTKPTKLIFELQESPKPGTPLKYRFVGEQ